MTTAHKAIYLKDYTPYPYDVLRVDMVVDIFDGRTVVTSHITYQLKNAANSAPLVLNGEGHKVMFIGINGTPLPNTDYQLDDKFFTLPCFGDAPFVLTFETEILPEQNTALEGLYKSGDSWCTQCESEGFRKITYFPDRPDVLTVYRVRVQAGKAIAPVLLSNGNLVESGDLDGGRHFATFEDPFKKPCYLFALVAGNLVEARDTFTTKSGRNVALSIFTRAADAAQVDYAMHALKCSMKWDEDAYGLEYQLDRFSIVAVHDFTFGAMENTSLNVFNTKLVLTHPDTATDTDYKMVMRVVGHEYFHNWSGNRVTCQNWFQLTLKEGLTVFRENQFGQAMFDADDERIDEAKQVRERQFPEDGGPLAHPIRPDSYMEINNFYTTTVYEKGAEVIRMLHTLIGPETYRRGTDIYFSRYDGHAVRCEEFVHAMEEASGKDLRQFYNWYNQSGTPTVVAQGNYDPKTQQYTLTLQQHTSATADGTPKNPFVVPVCVALFGRKGEVLAERVLELSSEKQSFVFDNIPLKPVPSLLRGFSAPVNLKSDVDRAGRLYLVAHDTDGFARWAVLQGLMEDAIADGHVKADLLQALSTLVDDLAPRRPALLARMLELPELSWLMQKMAPVAPRALHDARVRVETEIGKHLLHKLLDVYKATRDPAGAFEITPDAIARRALHNTCLTYIMAADAALGAGLALAQFNSAKTMTARIGAMSVLMDSDCAERAQVLAAYYDRFRDHPLALDKWFTLQSLAVRQTTLHDVIALTQHPDFSLTNPNRARAVLSAFSAMNMAAFNDPSGDAYQFIADMALRLDTINPGVSARLLTSFKIIDQVTPLLQQKMRQALERVVAHKGLSVHAYEVVSKTLAAV